VEKGAVSPYISATVLKQTQGGVEDTIRNFTENEQRVSLHYIEKAEAIARVAKETGWSQHETAVKMLGYDEHAEDRSAAKTSVARWLAIAGIDQSVKNEILLQDVNGDFGYTLAAMLASSKLAPAAQLGIVQDFLKSPCSKKGFAKMIKSAMAEVDSSPASDVNTLLKADAVIMREVLQQVFATKVEVVQPDESIKQFTVAFKD
jgi:hypothetical protein